MARTRYYTPELANRSLPLVRRIAADIQAVARRIQYAAETVTAASRRGIVAEDDGMEALRDRFEALVAELEELGVELKDPLSGLLDFRARRGDGEVYLCWRLGEGEVGHWHSLEGGFAGRRPLAEF